MSVTVIVPEQIVMVRLVAIAIPELIACARARIVIVISSITFTSLVPVSVIAIVD